MGLRFFILGWVLAMLSACARPQLKLGPAISNQLRTKDYIIVGERHPNTCDHQMELKVLKALLHLQLRPVIGLEMVPKTAQQTLDQYLHGKISLTQLPSKLNWAKNWGYDFNYYAPIFKLARKYHLKIIGLNLPYQVVKKWSQEKTLTAQEKKLLPTKIILPASAQQEYLKQQWTRLKQIMPFLSVSLNRFLRGQSLWESAMAEQSVNAYRHYGHPVLIYIGSGHVQTPFGLIQRIKMLHPQAQIFTFLPGEQVHHNATTYVYVCPTQPKTHLGLELKPCSQGILVLKVNPRSKAAQAGFKSGDIILKVNERKAKNLLDLHTQAIKSLQTNQDLNFLILRNEQRLTLKIKL